MILNSTGALLLLSSLGPGNWLADNYTEVRPQLVDSDFVIEIVSSIHKVYGFKNFIFYITERISLESDTAVQFFDNFWDAFPTIPTIIVSSGTEEIFRMGGFISTPALVLVMTTERDDPVMEVVAESLKGVRYLKTIFIVFPMMENMEIHETFDTFAAFWELIRTTYEWVWQQQFTNTILVTIRNNLYLHDPYPTPTVVNKTENWTVSDFFVFHAADLKGYVVDTPIRLDMPRVFHKKITMLPDGRQHVAVNGTSGQLMTAFLESINATLNDTSGVNSDTEVLDMVQIVALLQQKAIEISVHSTTDMSPQWDVGRSYPIGINDWCLMVPYLNRTPENLYLIETFTNSTWLLVGFSVVFLTLVIYYFSPSESRELGQAFLQTISSLLYIVPTRILLIPSRRMRTLFLLLYPLGFVVSNIYTCKIASYLTMSPQVPQIDGVWDVVRADLRLMVQDFEYELLSTDPEKFPPAFLKQVDVVDKRTLDLHRDSLNTSFGYSIQTDRWEFLNIQQSHLSKPLFRLSQMCMGPFYHVFHMQFDSHLARPLKYFIMYANQAGFISVWEHRALADALLLNYTQMIIIRDVPPALSMAFFTPLMWLWWIGMILAGTVFLCEVKWLTLRNFGRQKIDKIFN